MKPKFNFLTALMILATFSTQAKALQTVTIAGSGCDIGSGDHLLAPISGKDRYSIPLNLTLKKDALKAIERKACAFRIPIELAPNERVIVRDLSQALSATAEAQVAVQSQLDVSIVGISSTPVVTQIKASKKKSKLVKTIKKSGIIVESGCGESLMISGNLSAVATGANKASVSLGALELSISIGRCL